MTDFQLLELLALVVMFVAIWALLKFFEGVKIVNGDGDDGQTWTKQVDVNDLKIALDSEHIKVELIDPVKRKLDADFVRTVYQLTRSQRKAAVALGCSRGTVRYWLAKGRAQRAD